MKRQSLVFMAGHVTMLVERYEMYLQKIQERKLSGLQFCIELMLTVVFQYIVQFGQLAEVRSGKEAPDEQIQREE